MTQENPLSYIIGRFHPELPAGWTPEDGMKAIVLALCGQNGGEQQKLAEMGINVLALVLQKNSEYGNSALDPIRIFAKGLTPLDTIHVRMDDKLSRLLRGSGDHGRESPVFDLIGYGLLELIARWERNEGITSDEDDQKDREEGAGPQQDQGAGLAVQDAEAADEPAGREAGRTQKRVVRRS